MLQEACANILKFLSAIVLHLSASTDEVIEKRRELDTRLRSFAIRQVTTSNGHNNNKTKYRKSTITS